MHGNLTKRVSMGVIAVTTVVVILFGLYGYLQTKSALLGALEDSAKMAISRLSINLIEPLWNMNDALIYEMIASEMGDKRIFAIAIKDADGTKVTHGRQRNSSGKIAEMQGTLPSGLMTETINLARDGTNLGSVEVFMTKKYMEETLTGFVIKLVLAAVALNLIIVTALILLIKQLAIKPINLLSNRLDASADQVSTASSQMSETGQVLAEASSEQAANLEEIASSLEEMSSMTKATADNAEQADALMKEGNRSVDNAGKDMDKMEEAMSKISDAGQEISKIVKSIDEIAFQTNLLALNAAVEAARAGEAGAGFAVVADEVRNLAMRAAGAAKDTQGLVEDTIKRMEEGTELVTRTKTGFQAVADSSEKVGCLISEISQASNEQAQGIEEINKGMTEMEKVVQQNAANAEESASTSNEMKAQASGMKKMVVELVALVGGTHGKSLVSTEFRRDFSSTIDQRERSRFRRETKTASDQIAAQSDDWHMIPEHAGTAVTQDTF